MRKVSFSGYAPEVVDFIVSLLEHRHLLQDYNFAVEADSKVSGYIDFVDENISSEAISGLFEYAELYLENANKTGVSTFVDDIIRPVHDELDEYLLQRVVDIRDKQVKH